MTAKRRKKSRVADYLYCVYCEQIFDYWKFGSLEETGHDGHNLRSLTNEEFNTSLRECAKKKCRDE